MTRLFAAVIFGAGLFIMAPAYGASEKFSPEQVEELEAIIEKYLVENPQILSRMQQRLAEIEETERLARQSASLRDNRELIFNSEHQAVIGNPDGDVTLVEFFDYNCGVCRQALGVTASLLQSDPNLRIVLKEFPILGPESIEAARISVAIAQNAKYWAFHRALLGNDARADRQSALAAAQQIGLDPGAIEDAIDVEQSNTVFREVYALANSLGINGTPSYVIGDEVIPGLVDVGVIEEKIKAMRQCGKTAC